MNSQVQKLADTEKTKLLTLLDDQSREVRAAFEDFLAQAQSPESVAEVTSLLEQNRVDDAVAYINGYAAQIANAIVQAAQVALMLSAASLIAEAAQLNPRVVAAPDLTDPRTMQTLQEARQLFLNNFVESQRQAIREALEIATTQDLSAGQRLGRFMQSLGLTGRQVRAIQNYRRMLETGSSEALHRGLRDRRFDNSVRRASLTPKQIDRMVAQYEKHQLTSRKMNMSMAAALGAVSLGAHEALRQTVEQLGIGPGGVEREWHTLNDGHARDHHASMDGQVVGLEEPFTDGLGNKLMYPGDFKAPIITVAQCRCSVTHRIRSL